MVRQARRKEPGSAYNHSCRILPFILEIIPILALEFLSEHRK
jgi:hypothetical protein